jgi:protein-disulfide isomerase
MNRRFALLAGTAAVLGGSYVLLAPQQPAPGVSFGAATAQSADADTSMVVEMSLGNPDADVTVIEYASFTCPHCRTFHETAFKDLRTNYIDTGKIHFIYREVYFDRYGLWAAMIARCGGPERYFGIAELIYTQQAEWTAGNDPAVIAENLRKIGRTAGLSNEELDACLQDAAMAEAMVAVYQKNAEADGITSTPSFLVNGEKYSNMSYADFAAILDKELAG